MIRYAGRVRSVTVKEFSSVVAVAWAGGATATTELAVRRPLRYWRDPERAGRPGTDLGRGGIQLSVGRYSVVGRLAGLVAGGRGTSGRLLAGRGDRVPGAAGAVALGVAGRGVTG